MSITDCDYQITFGCFIPRDDWLPIIESIIQDNANAEWDIEEKLEEICHSKKIQFEFVKDDTESDAEIYALYVYTPVRLSSDGSERVYCQYKNAHDDFHTLQGPISFDDMKYARGDISTVIKYLTTAQIEPKMYILSYACY
jgi:hypothetical protein